jgi:hypothetical protein
MISKDLLVESENYVKLAGLLKVPDALYKEVSEWAVSTYCVKLQEIYNKFLYEAIRRTDIAKSLEKIKSSKVYEFLLLDMTTSFDDYDFNKLVGIGGNHVSLTISHFDRNETDKTRLAGLYEWMNNPAALDFFIHKHKDNTYNYRLSLHHKTENEGKIEFNSGTLLNVSKEFIIENLKENASNINTILDDFRNFDYEFYDDRYINKLKIFANELKKYITDKSGTYKEISDIGELDKLIQYYFSKEEIAQFELTKQIDLQCLFLTSKEKAESYYDKEPFAGLWQSSKNRLIVVKELPDINELSYYDQNTLTKDLDSIKQIVRHELQHFMQTYIFKIKNLKENGGLPSKKIRNKDYDPSGYTPKEEGRLQHSLRDIEFYTDLTDAVDEFKYIVNKFPIRLKKKLFQFVVGNYSYDNFTTDIFKEMQINNPRSYGTRSEFDISKDSLVKDYLSLINANFYKIESIRGFFQSLKTHQPLKYKKAVTEFYKEVKDLL